jgi:hypothetical protein
VVRQIVKKDAQGNESVTSAMNIVNEEGNWEKWSKSLSSQLLSKQSRTLAKTQLDMTYEKKRNDLNEILSLTNPAVKRKLLESFADDADSSAVHLKAAHLPRQGSHVILPINTMRETEIYAPNYRNGDTVLVIPNNTGRVKTSPPLEGLKKFDPMHYKLPDDSPIPRMTPRTKAIEMGVVSNLITDMTIRGANAAELARAVRHSMVVIDAEKHGLNYKQSAIDNGIAQLKTKYQGGARSGASTLISRANADIRVPERTPRSAVKGGPIDKATGQKVYEPTGATFTDRTGKVVVRTIKSKRLAETEDASTLSSGTLIEKVYADHSNKLKALANEARRSAATIKPTQISASAKTAYSNEVASLDAKLNVALKNAPLERQAQILANAVVAQKRRANPDMESSDLKKIKSQALEEARARTGAKKRRIEITPSEWDAIQAGAISTNRLNQILANSDLDVVKKLATPRSVLLMTPTKKQRAQSMVNLGYTQAEIADALGVSLTTLKTSLFKSGG